MAKNIYDEKIYLNGDKNAIDTFLKKRNEYQLLYTIERINYENVIKEYNRFLIKVKDLIQSLGLKSSLENSIALDFLIINGYLTYDKKFKNEETKNEIHTRYGASIVNGYGCCRNFSDIEKDIMTLLNYYVKNLYCYHPTLSLPKTSRLKVANHVINVIEFDGVKYGMDLYNCCSLFRFKNQFILEKISTSDNLKIRNKPYFGIIVGDNTLEGIKEELIEYENESKKEIISPYIYESDILYPTIRFLKNHMDMFTDFHEETKEMKESIALTLRKIG